MSGAWSKVNWGRQRSRQDQETSRVCWGGWRGGDLGASGTGGDWRGQEEFSPPSLPHPQSLQTTPNASFTGVHQCQEPNQNKLGWGKRLCADHGGLATPQGWIGGLWGGRSSLPLNQGLFLAPCQQSTPPKTNPPPHHPNLRQIRLPVLANAGKISTWDGFLSAVGEGVRCGAEGGRFGKYHLRAKASGLAFLPLELCSKLVQTLS